MNSRQLEYIITLSFELNFSAAAKKLMISQPSLSQYVKKLENELGVALFDRTQTPLKLTEAGRAYVKAAKAIVELESNMKQNVRDIANYRKGKIVIGVSPFRSSLIFPGAIKKFHETYPDFDITLIEKNTEELEKLAESNELDMALTRYPAGRSMFSYIQLAQETILLAAHDKLCRDFAKAQGGQYPHISAAQLKNIPFIVLGHEQQLHKMTDYICGEAGFTPRKIVECRSIETAYAMAEAAIGVTLIPSGYIKKTNPGNNVGYYNISGLDYDRKNVIIYRKGKYLSSPEKHFIECLTNYS